MRRLLAVGALVLAGSVGSAQAATITFEDHAVAAGTAHPTSGDLISGGFLFDAADDFYQLANNSADIDNGSTYLVTEGDVSQVTISPTGGGPFALLSLDYAKWQTDASAAASITVTGHRSDGSSLSTTLSPGGFFGGPGTDFKTIAFGPDWSDLLSVTLLGTGATFGTLNYFAIDNLVVDTSGAVPEPATLALLGLGAAALIRRRRNARR
jgi:hypothetical protein